MSVNQAMAITIDNLSEHLGISVSTVSKALNGYDDVSTATKERVWEAAEQLGYTPNISARNLRRGRTDRIGILINNPIQFLSDYLGDVMSGASLAAEQFEQNLILYTKEVLHPDALRRICRSREVDGLLLIFDPSTESAQVLTEAKTPFVVFGRRSQNAGVSQISPDNFDGALRLTRHLIEKGHERIGFTTRPNLGMTSIDRFEGYKAGLAEANIKFDPDLVVETVAGQRDGAEALGQLLELASPPTAFFAFYDLMAADAVELALGRGLSVPDDIAIVGFDGLRVGGQTRPRLTTVRQPLGQMGQLAIEMLMARINNPDLPPAQKIMPTELLLRESA